MQLQKHHDCQRYQHNERKREGRCGVKTEGSLANPNITYTMCAHHRVGQRVGGLNTRFFFLPPSVAVLTAAAPHSSHVLAAQRDTRPLKNVTAGIPLTAPCRMAIPSMVAYHSPRPQVKGMQADLAYLVALPAQPSSDDTSAWCNATCARQ